MVNNPVYDPNDPELNMPLEQMRQEVDEFEHAQRGMAIVCMAIVCSDCGGQGQVKQSIDFGPRYRWVECPYCMGTGLL